MKNLYVLFTNIDAVTIGSVLTHTSALLLEQYESPLERGKQAHRVRGFGTDPAWETFSLFVPSIERELVEAASPHYFMSDRNERPRPIATGHILKLKDGPELQLQAADPEADLHISVFEGKSEESPIMKVWEELPRLVWSYWRAPNIPMLVFEPRGTIRFPRRRGL